MQFDREVLELMFATIGQRAIDAGKLVEIAVYGGAALVLTLPGRVATRDIDAVFEGDAGWLRQTVAELGEDVIDSKPKEFSATVVIKDTNSDVKRALDMLAEAGIAVQSLAVHKPTLDDVFLSLTGRGQTPAEAAGVK